MRTELQPKAILAIALPLMVVLGAASLAGQRGNTGKSTSKPAFALDAIDNEATATARRIILRRLLACGQSLYGYAWIGGISGDYSTKIDVRLADQLKEMLQNSDDSRVRLAFAEYRAVLEGIQLYRVAGASTADRLNGLEWEGRIDFRPPPAGRERVWKDGEWGPWDQKYATQDPNPFSFWLKKENHRWFVWPVDEKAQTSIEEELAKPQPSCRDLPIH